MGTTLCDLRFCGSGCWVCRACGDGRAVAGPRWPTRLGWACSRRRLGVAHGCGRHCVSASVLPLPLLAGEGCCWGAVCVCCFSGVGGEVERGVDVAVLLQPARRAAVDAVREREAWLSPPARGAQLTGGVVAVHDVEPRPVPVGLVGELPAQLAGRDVQDRPSQAGLGARRWVGTPQPGRGRVSVWGGGSCRRC